MASKLTENHPLSKKVNELEVFMQEKGMKLDWDGYHLNVIDTETNVSAVYREKESGSELTEFPYMFETKLIID